MPRAVLLLGRRNSGLNDTKDDIFPSKLIVKEKAKHFPPFLRVFILLPAALAMLYTLARHMRSLTRLPRAHVSVPETTAQNLQ